MSRARKPTTLFSYCIAAAGPVVGAQVAGFVAQWSIASAQAGRQITREEYAEYWCISRPTSYRELQRFHTVFPELPTPQPIADSAARRADEWLSRGVKGLREMPAAGLIPSVA